MRFWPITAKPITAISALKQQRQHSLHGATSKIDDTLDKLSNPQEFKALQFSHQAVFDVNISSCNINSISLFKLDTIIQPLCCAFSDFKT
jgi:hypothetical protein